MVTNEFDSKILEYENVISDYKDEITTMQQTFDSEVEKRVTNALQDLQQQTGVVNQLQNEMEEIKKQLEVVRT